MILQNPPVAEKEGGPSLIELDLRTTETADRVLQEEDQVSYILAFHRICRGCTEKKDPVLGATFFARVLWRIGS